MLPLHSKDRPLRLSTNSKEKDRDSYKYSHLANASTFEASSDWPAFLRQRARTTNLAVLLLATTALFSVLINLRLYFNNSIFRAGQIPHTIPSSLLKTIPSYASSLSHLVIVPCHAVYIGNDAAAADQDHQWVLQEVQKGGSVHTFIKHILRAVEIVARDPQALLVFSGGMTRDATQQTEAQSYLRYTDQLELFQQYAPGSIKPFPRATTELFAMDSYQNLLFSLARFKEVTGRYPDLITVVGYGMKRRRFEDVHRAAVRWPIEAFSYIGIDDEGNTNQSQDGEVQFGLLPYLEDTYGCRGQLLAKRKSRNPYNRFHPYFTSVPELGPLIEWCPAEASHIFGGKLPWVE